MIRLLVRGLAIASAWSTIVQAQENATEVQDIVVTAERAITATKSDTPLIETPQAISVVSDDLFRARGALNLQETLRYSAGVTGEAYGLDTRNDATVIRGLPPVQFLDGMRNLYTFAPFARTAVDALSRVEVLRGPSSVLYGQASNGGIINSVSKVPEFETAGSMRLEYGSWDRKQAVIDVTGPLDSSRTLAARVIGVVRDANQQTRLIDDNRVLVQPSLAWRPGPDTQITLLGRFQRDRSASSQQFLPVVSTIFAPNESRRLSNRTFLGDKDYDTLRQRTASATLIVDHRVSDLLSLSGRARYIDAKATFRQLYPDVYARPTNPFIDGSAEIGRIVNRIAYQTQAHGKIFTSDVNARLEFDTGPFSHQLLTGIDYTNYFEQTLSVSANSANPGSGITPIDVYAPRSAGVRRLPYARLPEQRNTQLGLYVQDQIRYADRLTLVAGARHDRARSKTEGVDAVVDTAWTFKLGAIGELGYGLSPYISYSEAFQPVSGINPRTGKAYVPTRGRQYEGGVKWQPRRGVLVTAAYYDVIERNRPTNDPADPINVFQTGEVTSKGFELEGAFQLPGDFQLTTAYTFNNARVSQSLYTYEEGERVNDVPRHMASAWGMKGFRLNDAAVLRVGAGVRYIGNTRSTGATSATVTPSYTLVDALVSLDWDRWTASVNATNLFDKTYFSACRTFGDCFIGNRRYVVASLGYRF